MGAFTSLQAAVGRIKSDAITVYYVARDSRTAVPVRLLALAIAAYAFSPIDFIPDFIPVLGLLDDFLILPLGISLVIKLTPAAVVADNRARAREVTDNPRSTVAAIAIVAVWIFAAAILGYWLWGELGRSAPPPPVEVVED
jgi:uncharacterized membrane protein YkvA (DUF1232 family)